MHSVNEIQSNNVTSESELQHNNKFIKIKLNRKQIIIISLLCYGNFCVGSAYSILAPFFPTQAQAKGASPAWIGLIIGEYQITVFFGSFIFGKMIPHITTKYLLSIGLFVAGFCNALFGLLQWSPVGSTFITLAMISRSVEGLGVAAFFTSCWTIVAIEFPNHISRLFATTEMFYGVGMIFGPAIGGLLFEFGDNNFNFGFCLPFFVMGSSLLIGSFFMYCVLPTSEYFETTEKTSIFKVLRHFNITLNVLISVNCFILIGFNEATLDLHLKTIEYLSPTVKGGIFVISGVIYAVFNQLWGYISENMRNCHPLCIIGCLSAFICFSVTGPLPFLPIDSKIWLVVIGQIALGFGMGAQFVASFTQGFRETIKCGFQDNVCTYAVISSIYSSALALGSALGPAIGGYLFGIMGYRWSTVPVVILQLIMIFIIIIFNLVYKNNQNLIMDHKGMPISRSEEVISLTKDNKGLKYTENKLSL